MNGVFVVDKPAGLTSHDVVARIRRATNISKVGHTGTLDPMATGVLVVLLGKATRLAQFMAADEKEYLAGIRFGFATDTYDAEGTEIAGPKPRATGDDDPVARGLSRADLETALEEFRGTYDQMPPPYSAKKIGGVPAYKLARKGKDVELKPVSVTVKRLDLVSVEDDLAQVRIVSSTGFYVRTLAHELGQRLGCGAHLASLRRTRVGHFHIDIAVPLDRLQAGDEAPIPMEKLLTHLPAVTVNDRGAQRVVHGNTVGPGDAEDFRVADPADVLVRLVDTSGALMAIAQAGPGGILQPFVVVV